MARGPSRRRTSPSDYPERDLPRVWRREYQELMADGRYNQTEALAELERRHDAAYTTLRYHIFRNVRKSAKKRYQELVRGSTRTASEEKKAAVRKRSHARYHLDEILGEALPTIDYKPLDLRELATLIEDHSDVRFRPSTLLKLNESFRKRQGTPLLEEIIEDEIPKYVLHHKRR